MIRRLAAIATLTVVMIGFQNCTQTTFSATSPEDLAAKGSLAPIEDDGAPSPAPGPNGDDASGSVSQTGTPGGKKDEDKKDNPPANQPPAPAPGNTAEEEDQPAEDTGWVACILVEHGKSLKLGLVMDAFDGVNAVSQSVCISRKACLEIVPELFEVEGAYDRGYCEHNPHIVRLDDAQVQALVDKGLAQ